MHDNCRRLETIEEMLKNLQKQVPLQYTCTKDSLLRISERMTLFHTFDTMYFKNMIHQLSYSDYWEWFIRHAAQHNGEKRNHRR